MFNNVKARAGKNKHSPLKFVSLGSGAVFIATNDVYLKAGLTELALNYFVTPQKNLCILDSTLFDSTFRLHDYLQYLQTLKIELNVLVINETLPNIPGTKKYCPWISDSRMTVRAFKRVLIDASDLSSNLKEVTNFYAFNLKRWKFSLTQSTIIDYLMKGLTVNEIARAMNASPKTVYSSLRKVCIAHNQRSLVQLTHFFCANESSFAFFKHDITDKPQDWTE